MLLKIANSYSKAATQCLTVYVGQSGKDKVKTTNKNSIVGELVKKYSASGIDAISSNLFSNVFCSLQEVFHLL